MDEELISKTRRKRDMEALQKLGEALVGLTPARLAALHLPENLADAVKEARRLTSREALRRQMQFIGRLMRDIDAVPIQEKLAEWNGESREATARMHRIEHWRDRLLANPEALTDFAATYPAADLQRIRLLIRNAQKEQARAQPPKSSRELYRVIRSLIEGESGPSETDAPATN